MSDSIKELWNKHKKGESKKREYPTDKKIHEKVEMLLDDDTEEDTRKTFLVRLQNTKPVDYEKEIDEYFTNNFHLNELRAASLFIDIKKITNLPINSLKKTFTLIRTISLRKNQNEKPGLNLFLQNKEQLSEQFYTACPFFYDETSIFWIWDHNLRCYKIKDEYDFMNKLRALSNNYNFQVSESKFFSEVIRSLKIVGRNKIPKQAKSKFIQFKGKAFTITSKRIYDVTPDYFFTNPIPHDLGESEYTPTLDKLFEEWVGKDYVRTLYEIIAYCCYTGYPIQTIFCLHGDGRNGKSSFLKVLIKFLGMENICSTELDLLTGTGSSRFESFKLYKKLVCLMGETNFGMLNKSSLLKKLTGGDMVGFEMKGKKPFDDFNYAKLVIASNSLPTSEDTSEGFYRRWLIIDFPNKFPEGKDITDDIPKEEFNNLAKKCCSILPEIIEKGEFTNQGDITQRRFRYIMASNPLPMFLDKYYKKDDESFISYNELYSHYIKYLKLERKRRVGRKEFKLALEDEGFWIEKSSKKMMKEGSNEFDGDYDYKSSYWIDGLRMLEKGELDGKI